MRKSRLADHSGDAAGAKVSELCRQYFNWKARYGGPMSGG